VRRSASLVRPPTDRECAVDVDFGMLRQNHMYEAPVLDVEPGSTLSNINSSEPMLTLAITTHRACAEEDADTDTAAEPNTASGAPCIVVRCESKRAGEVQAELSAQLSRAAGTMQVLVRVVAHVMGPSQGTPVEHPDVVCIGVLSHNASDAEGSALKQHAECQDE
jgi:hypothetical protein